MPQEEDNWFCVVYVTIPWGFDISHKLWVGQATVTGHDGAMTGAVSIVASVNSLISLYGGKCVKYFTVSILS